MKMDKTTIILSAVVGSLGVLSAIFGFSAEGTKLTLYDIRLYGDDCIYPPNPAPALAICAAVFLLVAQIMVTAVGGCCGCCNPMPRSRAVPSETKRIIGIVCAILSWVAAGIAWVLLLIGEEANANVVRRAPSLGTCYYPKDGMFAGAAVLTVVATKLGVTSYIMLRGHQPTKTEAVAPAAASSAAAPPNDKPPEPGIAMGHPSPPSPPGQFPPPTAPPEGAEQPPSPMGHAQSEQQPVAEYSVQPPIATAAPDLAPYASEQSSSSSNLVAGFSKEDLFNVGAKVLVGVVKESLSPGSSTDPTGAMAAGGILLSMVTGDAPSC